MHNRAGIPRRHYKITTGGIHQYTLPPILTVVMRVGANNQLHLRAGTVGVDVTPGAGEALLCPLYSAIQWG